MEIDSKKELHRKYWFLKGLRQVKSLETTAVEFWEEFTDAPGIICKLVVYSLCQDTIITYMSMIVFSTLTS